MAGGVGVDEVPRRLTASCEGPGALAGTQQRRLVFFRECNRQSAHALTLSVFRTCVKAEPVVLGAAADLTGGQDLLPDVFSGVRHVNPAAGQKLRDQLLEVAVFFDPSAHVAQVEVRAGEGLDVGRRAEHVVAGAGASYRAV